MEVKLLAPLGYYDRPIDKPTGQPTDNRPGRVITFRVSQIRGTSKNIINKYSLAQDRDERLLESNAFDWDVHVYDRVFPNSMQPIPCM